MLRLFLKRQTQKLTALISTNVLSINHNAVIKDLTGRAELTGSYLLMIVCSCLVALLGLLRPASSGGPIAGRIIGLGSSPRTFHKYDASHHHFD